jgi:Domain of unknown function (DUF4386)
MKSEKWIGALLISGAIGVIIPYAILTVTFEYPDILRQDAGTVLARFHEGGTSLIFTWWAFAIMGLPILIAYIMIGQLPGIKTAHMKWITTLGIISGIAQIIGLLRWVFVVPVIANSYILADNEAARQSAIAIFTAIHQLGGVLLGEHLGQLFTIIWTFMVSIIFIRTRFTPSWISWMGIASSLIYFMAQAELFATVIPGFPVWNLAGFAGSTLWLIWLVVLGTFFYRMKMVS